MDEKTINSSIKLTKLPMDQDINYSLNPTDNEWLDEIRVELEEKAMEHDPDDEIMWPATTNVELKLKRKHNHTYKDHLLISGKINVTYQTHCVKCLEAMKLSDKHSFDACFIPQIFEKTPEYEDATHIYTNEQEYELYFYSKGIVDIQELCHEHIFLTLDHFPVHDENCKGLCHTCGINLNIETCNHK